MPTGITVTRSTHLYTGLPNGDHDGDGQIDPGDVVEVVVHVTNVGTEMALALALDDTFNGYSFDGAASVKITPIANDESFSISGNTPVTLTFAQLLGNDVDPDGAEANLTITGFSGAVNGSIAVDNVGHTITFTPDTGLNAGDTASFTYTITDEQGLVSASGGEGHVTLNITDVVWYVDNTAAAGGDGSYLHPFQQLTELNGANGDGSTGDDVDAADDTIFVYHNGAAYTTGITLEAGQKLYGDGNALQVNGHNIGGTDRSGGTGVDNVATNSVIDNSGANGGITLSTDNIVKGINVNSTAGTAVGIQDNGGSVGTLVIDNVSLSGAGKAVDIDHGGVLNVDIDSLSSGGSATEGVRLAGDATTALTGSFNATTGIIQTSTGTGFLVGVAGGGTANSGGSATITYGGDITSPGGSLTEIEDRTGGTVTFGGTLTDGNIAAGTRGILIDGSAGTVNFNGQTFVSAGGAGGDGVMLTNNSGTINFAASGNGLDINTATGAGLTFTGGGTLNITGSGNTITTTTGQILVAANGAIGGSNVNLASLTATGATTGNAIDINNLDGGSFTAGGVTVANTGAGFDALNIRGDSSTNFTFNGNTDINGTGSGGDGVELNGVNGTVSFNNLTVDGVTGTGNGLSIQNATHTVTVSNGAIANGANTGDAVNITGGSSDVVINASVSKNANGNVVEVNGHTAGNIDFNGAINAGGGNNNGINLVNNSGGTIDFTNSAVNLNTGGNTALNFTNTSGTGAAVSFTGGNLNIDTTTGTGINATSTNAGAGSLTISGANNTIDVGNGRAVIIDGVNENVTLLHVNATGVTSGTTIFLQNAGSGGGNQFVVTGTLSDAASGGTINHSSNGAANNNASQGIGVYMNNVGNVSLSNMSFTGNFGNFGIRGDTVNNFTLKDSDFTNNNNATAPTFGNSSAGGIDEGTIRFGTEGSTTNGLTGTAVFQGNNIAGGAKDNVAIFDMGSGSLNVSFADSANDQAKIGHNQTGGNTGIQLQSGGTAGGAGGGFNLTATVNGVQFTGNRADSVFVEALQHTTQNITVTNNTFTNNQADRLGGSVNVNGSGAAGTNYVVDFNISNNTMTGATTSAIVAAYKGLTGDISGIINGNTIGNPNGVTDTSGATQGFGIFLTFEKAFGAGTLNGAVRISNNQIGDVAALGGGGISIRSSNGPGPGATPAQGSESLEATITGNTLTNMGNTIEAALYAQIGGQGVGDTGRLGLDLKNNNFNVSGTGAPFVVDVDQISVTAGLNVPNYPGPSTGPAASTALNNYWVGVPNNNTFTGASVYSVYASNAVITHNAFTQPVPLLAVVHEIVPWEDDPANHVPIVVTSGDGDQPPVVIGTGTGTGDSGGQQPATDPTGGTTTGPADPTPPTPVVSDDGIVSQAELNLIVDAAIARWEAAGLTPAQLAAMRAVAVSVSDMTGLYVGASSAGQIHVDSDGAGYGWFVDTTPGDDSEYQGSGSRLTADAGGAADHHIDLLTVVMHELGHQIGLDDTYAPADFSALMYGFLNPSERRLPEAGDADGGVPGSLRGTDYVLGPVTNGIGDLPAGKAVDVHFTGTVLAYQNEHIPTNLSNQSSVSGGNLTTSPVSSLADPLALDSLTLGDLIYFDVNANGIFDAGDSGIVGVTLTLYADSNGNGVLDGAEATSIIDTDITDGSGFYSFANLAEGDYVVSVDAGNFLSGGALENKVVTSGGTDPDDDVNSDNNGVAGPGGTVISAPIRLDFNSEPTTDGDADSDTNLSLDIGFLKSNLAPVFANLDGTPTFTEDGAAVTLDGDATVTDPDLTGGNYAGATLTLARSGGANAEDVFDGTGGAGLTLSGGTASVNGTNVGTYTQVGGTLTITFGAGATQSLVDATLQGITYSNSSNTPPASAVIAYAFSDGNAGAQGAGGALGDTGSVTVSITAADDAPTAVADAYSTNENAVLNVPAGTGVLANDTDPDGGTKVVAKVNGNTLDVGQVVTLSSGAEVKLNADGSLSYDPKGKFDYLITAATATATGAANSFATDSFSYELNGGSSTTVTVTINGVTSAGDQLWGTSGNDTITDTSGLNYFDLSQGGNDHAIGGAGDDGFFFGAAFTGNDVVDGGPGTNDQIGLQGDYTGANALTLSDGTIANVEAIVVLPGFSYDITTADGNVPAGGVLKIQATQLAASQSLIFDGSAEHDGHFMIYGGKGDDDLTGGDGDDGFYFGPLGFNSADVVHGGPGTNDQLALDGDYTTTLGGNIFDVEVIVLLHGPTATPNTFNITAADSLVDIGETMTIFALQVTTALTFNGAAELDGAFKIYGGSGADTITGSGVGDWIFGGKGADTLTGGPGNDTFYYDRVDQSTPVAADNITDFAAGDKIDVSGIDAIAGGSNNAFSYLGSGAFTNHAGELRVEDQGGGVWLVQGDTDGNGSADFQLTFVNSDAHPITALDFTL